MGENFETVEWEKYVANPKKTSGKIKMKLRKPNEKIKIPQSPISENAVLIEKICRLEKKIDKLISALKVNKNVQK